MPTLNLTEIVGEPREWAPKANPERKFKSYKVRDDQGNEYEWNRKADSPPPPLGPGEFEITPPKEGTSFPPKIKKAQSGGGFGGSRPDPERDARIARQVAFKGAVELSAATVTASDGVQATEVVAKHIAELTDALLPIVTGPDVSAAPGKPSPSPGRATVSSGDTSAEASTAQKRAVSTALGKLGLNKEGQKAVVLFRCGGPASMAGLSTLLDDINQNGATSDSLLKEIAEAAAQGDSHAQEAARLLPTSAPVDTAGLASEGHYSEDVPF